MMAPDPNPPPSTQLRCAQALVHVREYVRTVCALAFGTLTTPLVKTIVAFRHLHPLVEVDFLHFVNDFHPEMDLVLDKEAFISILTHSPCLSFGGPSSMVYKLLGDCYVPDNFANGFDLFFEICRHIACGHVLPSLSHLLVALRLLVLDKQVRGIQPIMIGEVIYRLVAHTLVIQFKDTFVEHFSPH
jgi:hypothetical protein